MRPHTARQAEMLAYIVAFAGEHDGVTPSRAQIARHFGIAHTAAGAHVRCLRRQMLIHVDGTSKVISLVGPPTPGKLHTPKR